VKSIGFTIHHRKLKGATKRDLKYVIVSIKGARFIGLNARLVIDRSIKDCRINSRIGWTEDSVSAAGARGRGTSPVIESCETIACATRHPA